MRRRAESNRGIKVLQTSPLPLGYGANRVSDYVNKFPLAASWRSQRHGAMCDSTNVNHFPLAERRACPDVLFVPAGGNCRSKNIHKTVDFVQGTPKTLPRLSHLLSESDDERSSLPMYGCKVVPVVGAKGPEHFIGGAGRQRSVVPVAGGKGNFKFNCRSTIGFRE